MQAPEAQSMVKAIRLHPQYWLCSAHQVHQIRTIPVLGCPWKMLRPAAEQPPLLSGARPTMYSCIVCILHKKTRAQSGWGGRRQQSKPLSLPASRGHRGRTMSTES